MSPSTALQYKLDFFLSYWRESPTFDGRWGGGSKKQMNAMIFGIFVLLGLGWGRTPCSLVSLCREKKKLFGTLVSQSFLIHHPSLSSALHIPLIGLPFLVSASSLSDINSRPVCLPLISSPCHCSLSVPPPPDVRACPEGPERSGPAAVVSSVRFPREARPLSQMRRLQMGPAGASSCASNGLGRELRSNTRVPFT